MGDRSFDRRVRSGVPAWAAGLRWALRRCWILPMLTAGMVCAQVQAPNDRAVPGAPSRFVREMLAAHNAVRAEVRISPLQWSEPLAGIARDWANKLLVWRQFMHNPNSQFGENLFDVSGASATPAVAVKFWAAESRNYDYATNTCRGLCGHYTQIVWRDTKSVGCGVARGEGREVWVCVYDPPGNWLGQRPY